MTPEDWREVLRLYEAVGGLPPEERERILLRECPRADLRAEVEKLVAAPLPEGFLEPPAPEEPATGRELGDFTLLAEIGRGGMGVVYRALQRPLQRIVAVKVLPASFALTPRQIDRFEREARAAARLAHPNVVAVLTVGEQGGLRYFAMELVEGFNLAEEIKRLRADLGAGADDSGAHLPSSHASDYFRAVAEKVRQAADGLHHAHQHGIVHRDVKPSNLLLDREGHVKIVDFGLARDEEQGTLSTSGDVVGTPHYMSPEQARAHRHRIDHRTDIYSLGVVLYELLTLRRPFEGKTSQEVISNLLHKEPPRVRKLNHRVPRDLETICFKAIAKEPGNRYPDAGAFRDDLQRFLNHEAIVAKPPGPVELLIRRIERHRSLVTVAAVGLLAGLGGVLGASEHARRLRRTEELSFLARSRAEAPLRELPLSVQLDLRRRLRLLRGEDDVQAAEADETMTALERDFEALHTELEESGLADLELARDPKLPDGLREQRRLAAMQTLLQASHLFPEDDELRRLAAAESAFPTLSVRALDAAGNDMNAQVFLREVDVFTSGVGEERFIGTTPLPPTPVVSGYYRIVVVFPGGGFRELICSPGPANMKLELLARRSADESAVTQGMVRYEASTFLFSDVSDCDWALEGRTAALDAFQMDEAEVSNAEYQRFVTATGHAPPSYWTFIDDMGAFLADYGDCPVVGVGWRDAVDYAEWAGKRLPTAAEWLLAAGGRERWPWPYSPDPAAPARGNASAPFEGARGGRHAWQQYLRHVVPVRSSPEARTPEGLYHMFGNVLELTESMMVEEVEGSELLIPRPLDRLAFGGAWNAIDAHQAMGAPEHVGIGPHYQQAELGFRCAKSAEP